MFFKKKKKETVPAVLCKENIIIDAAPAPKDVIVKQLGEMLFKSGYVDESYIDAMLEKEKVFSTNIGNSLAIPHGIEAAKNDILHSGLAIMVFKDGIPWNDDVVKVVIGIAGKGDEHLDLLAKIAETFSDEQAVEDFIAMDVDSIYALLTTESL